MCIDYKRSLDYWTTSFYYLNLFTAVADQLVVKGNQYIIIGDSTISPEDYDEQTKWSDHNISLPLLYNFYHGLELLLKGFVLLKNTSQNTKLNHQVVQLLENFKSQFSEEAEMIAILEKYVSSKPNIQPLKSFFDSNNITPNEFYQALRYPYDIKFNEFRHIDLKYRGSDGVHFYKELINDINRLRVLSVALGRSFEPNVS